MKPFHHFPNSVNLDKSLMSVNDYTKNGIDMSKNSLNVSKSICLYDDPDSDNDVQEPAIREKKRIPNHSPVKMTIDLTKILAKREKEQKGKPLYTVSKSRSPPRQKSKEKL